MKKNLNVLHLLSSNKFSGAENVACTIIKNTKVNSYYCSLNGPIKENLKEKNIKFIGIKKMNIFSLRKIIKEYDIDIIHAHDYKASFIASFFGNKIKIISHLHSNFDFAKKWNIFTILYKLTLKNIYKVIVVSNKIFEDAIFKKSIDNKIIILNNVVNPDEIKKLSSLYKTDDYDLLFVGRLIEIKQPMLFIDIVKELKKDNKNIRACMLGQGNLYDECKKYIEINDLNKNVDLIGFKSNPYPYVKNSKIEILPSKYEGLPMSVIEAMILNVPVVNSGVGGLANMFKNNKKYICKEKNEYVQCIKKLLNDKNKSYEKDCANLIKDFIDINSYIEKIEKIYNN